MADTYPQCSTAIPIAPFAFKVGGKGRAITFKPSDRLWVTNSQTDQHTRGVVMIGREGIHKVSGGYAFTADQAAQLFKIHKSI